MFIFFSSHGSSLTGLPFAPSFVVCCFCSCDVCSDLVYIDVCNYLVFGDVCSILLPAMWSDIFGSLLLLIVVADGRVRVIRHDLYHRWTLWRTDVILVVCHNWVN